MNFEWIKTYLEGKECSIKDIKEFLAIQTQDKGKLKLETESIIEYTCPDIIDTYFKVSFTQVPETKTMFKINEVTFETI